MQQWWGSPAQTPGGCWDPHSPLEHYKQNSPSAPGLAATEALPTPCLPGSPGSCCCLPQPTGLHKRLGPKEVISCSRCICKVWGF